MSSLGQCVILVGGAGTRLGAISRDLPKPLLPVAGRPFLEWLLMKARRHGLDRVLLLAGHKAEAIDAYLANSDIGRKLGLSIAVSVEPTPLGTGGALVQARAGLDDAFLLVNGDTWFDFDWATLATSYGFDATVALKSLTNPDRYETVTLEAEKVVGFRPRGGDGPALINAGAYRLSREIVETITAPASLERDVLPELAMHARLGGKVFDAPFIDIGVPHDYAAAAALFADAWPVIQP